MLRRRDVTVILATHNLLEAQRLCDRVAILNHGKILALGSLKDLARKMWPVTWVDIMFHVKPEKNPTDTLMTQRGVLKVQLAEQQDVLSVQVENDTAIPEVVRHLVEQGVSILRVNPRDYTLEDIYFTLQAGES